MKILSGSILSLLLLGACFDTSAQQANKYTYPVKADTLTIHNTKGAAELIIENSTKDTLGFLYNRENGRTEFRRLNMRMLNSSTLSLIGQDTITLATPVQEIVKPYFMTTETCQAWNGFQTIIKKLPGDQYLKLDVSSQLIDDRELFVTNSSNSGGALILYSYSVPFYFGTAQVSPAIKLVPGSRVRLIYDQETTAFYMIGSNNFEFSDPEISNASTGTCPH